MTLQLIFVCLAAFSLYKLTKEIEIPDFDTILSVDFYKSLLGCCLVQATLAVLLITFVLRLYIRVKYKRRRKQYPQDVVVLHQLPRGYRAPSPSGYCLKLETWLRMNKIKYVNDFTFRLSNKCQTPWITLNGVDVADSQLCIEYLTEKLLSKSSTTLSDNDKAIARAFQLLADQSLAWCIRIHRYLLGPNGKECGIPDTVLLLRKCEIARSAKAQGYGRHSPDEIYSIGKTNLKAINDYIGGKKYLVDKISDADAALFGHLCQIVYHDRSPMNYFLTNNCPNIIRYIDQLRNEFWRNDFEEHVNEYPVTFWMTLRAYIKSYL